ncbi:MAG: alpha-amylase [Alistipes sp.]|nr:alpha-amylase [Alistipes sp.]
MKRIYLVILMLCSAMLLTTACLGGNDMVDNRPSQGQQKPDPEPEPEPDQPGGDEGGAIDPDNYNFPFICTDPKFVTSEMTEDVLVYINTAGTSMDNFSGDIYAHTGVLTTASTSTGDWKHVKAEWTENIADCKLSKVKQNIYKLVIKGGPRAFYGVPASESITHLAFVFRSKDGSVELKDNGQDIFIELAKENLDVKIISPADRAILDINTNYTVSVTAKEATSVILYKNDQVVATSGGEDINYTYTVAVSEDAVFKAKATDGTDVVTDEISVAVLGATPSEARPAGAKDGVTVSGNTATIVLYAPGKEQVVLLGDFNDFAPTNKYMMKKDGDYFWYTVDGLAANTEVAYQFLVDKTIKCADPYGTKILDPWNDKWINENGVIYPNLREYPADKATDVLSVFSTTPATFNWTVTDFQRPKQNSIAIYELLFRDFTAERSVKAALAKLDHIKALGINAIELMPIQEFDGNNSWGYNPCFYFAADKAYGTVEDYKTFIDECHKRGIAVILDIVINHATGLHPWMKMWCGSDGQAASNNPFFNKVARHPYNVFHDFNHEYAKTREYFKTMLQYWLTEYNIDGYRFDLSKGLTQKNSGSNVGTWNQYDASRIAIIKDYADAIREVEEDAYIILEHLSDAQEENELAEYKGIMLWRKAVSQYSETVMGWTGGGKSDFSGAAAFGRVGNIEDHDEERVAYKAIAYGQTYVKSDWKRISKHLQAVYAFHFLAPYPKMMWQFGEMGYDVTIGDDDSQKVEPKPVHWEYMENADRKALYDAVSKCITFRTTHPGMYGFDGKTTINTLNVGDANMSAKTLVYSNAGGSVIVMANFTNAASEATCNVPVQGTWKNLITDAAVELGSATYTTTLAPGDYVVLVKE